MASPEGSGDDSGASRESADRRVPRQRVVKVPGARRAKLTPAPGATSEPAPRDQASDPAPVPDSASAGPNDERLRRDVPPHY